MDENALLMSEVRGQRRISRLVRDDRKATVTQITTRYNQKEDPTSTSKVYLIKWPVSVCVCIYIYIYIIFRNMFLCIFLDCFKFHIINFQYKH